MPDPAARQHAVWTRIAASFDATRQRPWPHVQAFLASQPRGTRVLDLMCGNGRHLMAADGAGLDAVGVDWSRPLVAVAARHGAVVAGDAAALPFADGCFDAGVYVAGLHGIPTRDGRLASLRELRRVLRPRGTAQVTVWSRAAPRFADAGLPEGPTDVVVPWKAHGGHEQRTYHLYDAPSLAADLQAAGFIVEAIDEIAIAAPTPDNLVALVHA